MKKIFITLSLVISCNISANGSNDKLYEFKLSNGINIVLYEDFNFPIVTVGLLYDVGALDAKKAPFAVGYFVENLFFSSEAKTNFIENGISYDVNVHAGYTELTALMHPKSVKIFFQQVARAKPKMSDFNYLKEQFRLSNELNKITDYNAMYNTSMGLLEKSTSKLIFNNQDLKELTNNDVARFLEKYRTCNIRIIVCGAISHRGLLRATKNSVLTMKTRSQIASKYLEKRMPKTVYLEGKYRGNSVSMYYLLPSSFTKSRAYWTIFTRLADDFFCGEYAYVSGFVIAPHIYYGNSIQKILFWPKMDISLNQLQRLYDAFVIKILNEPLSTDFLSDVALYSKNDTHFIKTDLTRLYELIKESLLNGGNVKNIFGYIDDISEMKPNDFANISSEIIKKNNILKIVEKYKADQ